MESKPAQPNILMRVAIIVAIIIILALISFGIIKLVPKALSSLASADLSFSSIFAPKTGTTTPVLISGATSTTSNNNGNWNTATSTPSNGNGGTTYPNQTNTTNTTGTPDLAVHIVSQNITNGSYINSNTAVITFQIQNIGTRSSGTYSFTTSEPMTNPSDQTRYSGSLASLAPGASTGVITLTLNGVSPQGGVISIAVARVSGETDTANNTASLTAPATGNYSSGTYYYNNNTYGNSGLSVQIVDTGIINPYTGQYTQTNYVQTNDQVRVHFIVRNLGNTPSGTWTLSASLPSAINGNLTSQTEASIGAGQTDDFDLTFTGIQNTGTYPVTITVYPQGYGYYSNNANDTATANLIVTN